MWTTDSTRPSPRLLTTSIWPSLGFLPGAVEKHLDLVQAIKEGDGERAEGIMRQHVAEFYDQVRRVLEAE